MSFVLSLRAAGGVVLATDGATNRRVPTPFGDPLPVRWEADKVETVGPRSVVGYTGDLPLVQPILGRVRERASTEDLEGPRAVAAALEEAASEVWPRVEERYGRLYEGDLYNNIPLVARFVVGGVEPEGGPTLVGVSGRGEVADQTRTGHLVAGGSPSDFATASLVFESYIPPDASLAASAGFAHDLVGRLADESPSAIHRPVHVWTVPPEGSPSRARPRERGPVLGPELRKALRDVAPAVPDPESEPRPHRPDPAGGPQDPRDAPNVG